ncbi:MAG TPA: hypothetical protein VFD58_13640 [Blastocatellia bacterium]|nr:hypothetical protein [Blastocatellia bacterium]
MGNGQMVCFGVIHFAQTSTLFLYSTSNAAESPSCLFLRSGDISVMAEAQENKLCPDKQSMETQFQGTPFRFPCIWRTARESNFLSANSNSSPLT